MKHIPLQIGRDVGEENVFWAAVFLWKARLELREDIQFCGQRHALIQVLWIAPGPEKGFAGSALQAIDVDGPPVKNPGVHFREIFSHDPHQIHVGKKTGCHGKISCRTA